MITFDEIRSQVRSIAKQAGIKDLDNREVEACISSFVTQFGLAAVRKARKNPRHSCLSLRPIGGDLDFEELSHFELVRGLQASTGLPQKVCNQMLVAINSLIHFSLVDHDSAEIEGIGKFVKAGEDDFAFILHRDLACS